MKGEPYIRSCSPFFATVSMLVMVNNQGGGQDHTLSSGISMDQRPGGSKCLGFLYFAAVIHIKEKVWAGRNNVVTLKIKI